MNNGYLDLGELISAARSIYGGVFDEKIFLQQLVYFDDFSNFGIIPATDTPPPASEEVKKYLEELVKAYLHSKC